MTNEILDALLELGLTAIDWVDACQFSKLTGIEEQKLNHRRKKWPEDKVWSKQDGNIYFSIRSPMESAKDELSNKLSLIASMFKAKYVLDNNYPGWNYDEGSKLRKQYVDFVKETEGITLKEEGTHSGLETGIFKGALQDLDIITLGPDMFDIHTPDERLNMNSFYKCYQRLIHFLERL